MTPDPKKVQAIKDATPPSNTAELRSFLGTVNYVSRFIPDFLPLQLHFALLLVVDANGNGQNSTNMLLTS